MTASSPATADSDDSFPADSPPIRALFVVGELNPFVSTGGLGAVASGLPPELRALGCDIRVLVPGYPALKQGLRNVRRVGRVAWHLSPEPVHILRGETPDFGVPVYLVDSPKYFDREGNPYLIAAPESKQSIEWPDNLERFALLGYVAACFADGGIDPEPQYGWRPDVVHCNDWHAGMAPAYLYARRGARPGTLMTIHNLRWYGAYEASGFPLLNLPRAYLHENGIGFQGNLSFLKAGLYFADRINTVSPTYARNTMMAPMGYGFEPLLQQRSGTYDGIINGADYGTWFTQDNPHLVASYDADSIDERRRNRVALQAEFGLALDPDAMLVGSLSRVVMQKGIDFLAGEGIGALLNSGVQFIVHGEGDPRLCGLMRRIAEAFPDRFAFREGYDEPTGLRVMSGIDALIMPSRFEPCGLTQLHAMRFGVLPIARAVGGLVDTIAGYHPDNLALSEQHATGFLFADATHAQLMAAIAATRDIFIKQPALWRAMQRNAMATRFDWRASAEQYLKHYQTLTPLQSRPLPAAAPNPDNRRNG